MNQDVARSPASVRLALVTLFAGGLFLGLDQAAFGIVAPTLSAQFHFGTAGSAWAGGIQNLPEGLAGFFVAGALSDRIGDRKTVLLISLGAFAITAWSTAVVTGLPGLLVARALMGIFAGGWIAMMFALATELPAPSRRALAVGFVLASQPIGTGLIAPSALPAIAESLGWRWMYGIIGIPAMIVAIIGVWTVPRGLVSRVVPLETARSATSLLEVFRHRNVVLSAVLSGLLYCTLTLFVIFGVEYLVSLGMTATRAGLALAGWGVGGTAGALLVPRLSDRLGRRATTIYGSALAGLAVLLFVAVPPGPWMVLALFLVGFFVQGTLPIVIMLVPGETVEDRLRGKAIGLSDIGTTSLGGGVFAIALGSIGALLGLGATFALGVVCCVMAALLAVALTETAPDIARLATRPATATRGTDPADA